MVAMLAFKTKGQHSVTIIVIPMKLSSFRFLLKLCAHMEVFACLKSSKHHSKDLLD